MALSYNLYTTSYSTFIIFIYLLLKIAPCLKFLFCLFVVSTNSSFISLWVVVRCRTLENIHYSCHVHFFASKIPTSITYFLLVFFIVFVHSFVGHFLIFLASCFFVVVATSSFPCRFLTPKVERWFFDCHPYQKKWTWVCLKEGELH